MKKKLFCTVLVLSVLLNIFLLGRRCSEPIPPTNSIPPTTSSEVHSPEQQVPVNNAVVPNQPAPDKDKQSAPPPATNYLKEIRCSTYYYKYIIMEISGPRISQEEMAEHLKISPAPDSSQPVIPEFDHYSASENYSVWTLCGDFKPGTGYTISLTAGLKNIAGGETTKELSAFLLIPDRESTVEFVTKGPYYPKRSEKITIPITLVNTNKFHAKLYKYVPGNLSAFGNDRYELRHKSDIIFDDDITLDIAVPKNQDVNYEFNLNEILGDNREGMYLLRIGTEYDYYTREIIVSNLGIQAAVNEDQRRAAFVITRLTDGIPVPGAEISLYSYKNREILHGVTEQDGILIANFNDEYQFNAKLNDDNPAILVVRAGNDWSFLRMYDCHNLTVFDTAGRLYQEGPQAFVYAGRNIMRPGESITISAFLRQCARNSSTILADFPCRMSVFGPDDNQLFQEQLISDSNGFATHQFTIPEKSRTGIYTFRCLQNNDKVIGEYQVLVAAYTPDKIKVSVISQQDETTCQEPLKFKVEAKYYFDAELNQGSYDIQSFCSKAPWPAAWQGYTVGDDSDFPKRMKHFRCEKLSLKDNPSFTCPPVAQTVSASFPVLVTAQASVQEDYSRSVTGTATTICHPSPYYLGIKHDRDNNALDFKLLTYSKDQVIPEQEHTYTLELFRREWDYVAVRNRGNLTYEWQMDLLPQNSLPAEISFKGLESHLPIPQNLLSGCYTLIATNDTEDIVTRIDFWHYAGETGARSSNPSVLSLETDAEEYAPGDNVTLTVDAPADGFIAVILGDDAIDHAFRLMIKAGENSFSFKIPENIISSSYNAAVTLVNPEFNGQCQRSFALARFKINQQKHRLNVQINNPDFANPEDTVNVDLKLTDCAGNPVDGSVHIFGTDEGILALTNYKTPDIFNFFYGPRRVSTAFHDIYSQIFPNLKLGKDGLFGGGDVSGSALRNRKILQDAAPAVFDLGIVQVPETGCAQVAIQLPKHIGAMRLMAVASQQNLVGQGENLIKLRDSISAVPSSPKSISVGDEFIIGVTIFNHDEEKPEASFSFEQNPNLRISSPTWNGKITKGKSHNLSFKVKAESLGSNKLKYNLTIGEKTITGEVFLTVRAPNPVLTDSHYGIIKPGESITFNLNKKQWFEDTMTGCLTLTPNPASALVPETLQWLNAYPYGCLEQTTSKAFPFLATGNLLKAGLISQGNADNVKNKCQDVAAKLLGMRLPYGGFSTWPGGNQVWTEGSAYAAHFLFWAHQDGLLSLRDSEIKIIISYLRGEATNASFSNKFRAYCALVISYENRDEAAILAANLLNQCDHDTPDITNFLCGLTLIQCGQADKGAREVRQVLEKNPDALSVPILSFGDAISQTAMSLALLQQYLDCPEYVAMAVNRLTEAIKTDRNAFGTTQTNAWATLGLAAVAAKQSESQISVSIDGKDMGNLTQNTSFPLDADQNLLVNNIGEGNIYYSLAWRGVPKELPKSSNTLKVTRRYLDQNGKPVTKVKHGDLLKVEISLTSPVSLESLVLCDLLPGGLEIEDSRLATRAASLEPEETEKNTYYYDNCLRTKYLEKLDDRFLLFGQIYFPGTTTVTYQVRAVAKGKFLIPPCLVENMYDANCNGVFPGGDYLTVK